MDDASKGKKSVKPMRCSGRAAVQRCLWGLFAVGFAWLQMQAPAFAAEWTEREFASFRLLPAAVPVDTSEMVLIGLEVDLDPGWQFYSNNPGKFGVAPMFDWTASKNLAQASVYWPKPTRYVYSTDPPVGTFGYKRSLLLPVGLEAKNAGEEVDIRLVLEYAICDAYCIIDTVDLRLALPAGRNQATPHRERLQQALTDAKAGR